MTTLLDQSLILIVGAQRSGTSWVQRLLASHPSIVGGQESHLFSGYLGAMWQRWQTETEHRVRGGRTIGLGCHIDEEALLDGMRGLARSFLGRLQESKPGATLLVEKTPDHALHLPLIHRLFPDAFVVHVLRDGRDVAASMLAAGQCAWGRGWAPTTVKEAIGRWGHWVRTIRKDITLFSRHRTLRYEEMIERGPAVLGELFDFLGVPLPAEQVAELVNRCDFSACQSRQIDDPLIVHPRVKGPMLEPDGFHRAGRVGSWREVLSGEDEQIIESEARDLLHELGHAESPPSPSIPAEAPSTGFVSQTPRSDVLWTWPKRLDVIATSNAQMVYRERLFLFATVLALKPQRCLEIGVSEGGSSRIIAAALDDLGAGQLVSVDPQLRLSQETREALVQCVQFVQGNSPQVLTVAQKLAGGLFDFVLLDGDHSDFGVFRDLLGVVEVTRPGAVILAHDAYYHWVDRGIRMALSESLPLADAGILSTTCHAGLQGEEKVSYGGFRMLIRTEDESRTRRLVRRVTRKVVSLVRLAGPEA
jgi:hypothetical protein